MRLVLLSPFAPLVSVMNFMSMQQMFVVFARRLTQVVSTVLFQEFLPANYVRLLSILTQDLLYVLVVLFRSLIVLIVQVLTPVKIV